LSIPVAAAVSHLATASDRTMPLAVGSALVLLLILARLTVVVYSVQLEAAGLVLQARRDALTGLANRRTLDHSLRRMVRTASAAGEPLALAMIDLDHFKRFNDTHGHGVGDELLRQSGAAWSAVLAEQPLAGADGDGGGTLLARYGGEEFTLVASGGTTVEVQRALRAMQAVTPGGQTFSAGVAELTPGQGPAELLAEADRALYAAKAAGRACVKVAVPASGG
jgi:diguanylate cyclase (GGDEF)-like protein